jgi:hypothetical protein
MIQKTLQRSQDLFVQFTDEELSKLNIKPGDKFSCTVENDSITLNKYETIEIELSEFPRETLEHLIEQSIQKDISVNDVINEILKAYVHKYDE